jgi:hypothetical protein
MALLSAVACSQAAPSNSESDSNVETDEDEASSMDSASNETSGSDEDSESNADDDSSEGDEDDDDDDGVDTNDDVTLDGKFDLAELPDLPPNDQTGECDIDHDPCDEGDDDPWHAFGLNCPNEIEVEGSYGGEGTAILVTDKKIGSFTPEVWPVLEGSKLVVLSTGNADGIFTPGSCDPGTAFPPLSQALDFPAPINPTAVAGDCTTDPSLIGTGDCSKTLADQWSQAGVSKGNDWAELRFTVKVPENVNGFAFDFAFLSVEYPVYFGTQFNDLFVAWLESEKWTGNISFDKDGKPISLNAGFLDYKDGGDLASLNDPSCPAPCRAPELDDTCLKDHAATKWLTTTVGVTPGETITVVFGVIDLGDDILDALVLLDNFRWACEGGIPDTNPK